MGHESVILLRDKLVAIPEGFPEVTYFINPDVSIDDMMRFHDVPLVRRPSNRPVVSTNNVITADGALSLGDYRLKDTGIGLSGGGINGIHLIGKRPNLQGAEADGRLLQIGWVFDEATVATASVLRAERKLLWKPWAPDISKLFMEKFAREQAIRVIVTRNAFSKDELMEFDVFNQDGDSNIKAIIATTDSGLVRHRSEVSGMRKKPNVEIVSFGEKDVDVVRLVQFLWEKHGVKGIDWQGGGSLTAAAIKTGIVDIYRLTVSPILAGSINFEGKKLPVSNEGYFELMRLPSMRLRRVGFCYSHYMKIYDNLISE